MDKSIHAARILGRKKLRDIEILHFTGDLRRQRAGIKVGDSRDAGLARDDILPDCRDANTDRGDDTQPGNDNSAFRQIDSAAKNGNGRRRITLDGR